jgi:hypothetical protein
VETGGANSLSRKGKYAEVGNYSRCRPARVANRSWSRKKGGYARSREGTVIGSDQRLGPIPRKCGRAHDSDEQQSVDLLWVQVTTSAECKKVSGYSLLWEGAANTAGKEPIEALINL